MFLGGRGKSLEGEIKPVWWIGVREANKRWAQVYCLN